VVFLKLKFDRKIHISDQFEKIFGSVLWTFYRPSANICRLQVYRSAHLQVYRSTGLRICRSTGTTYDYQVYTFTTNYCHVYWLCNKFPVLLMDRFVLPLVVSGCNILFSYFLSSDTKTRRSTNIYTPGGQHIFRNTAQG
jgi:hypothetical protein